MLHTLTSNDQKKRLVESATMQAYELPKLGPKSTHMLSFNHASFSAYIFQVPESQIFVVIHQRIVISKSMNLMVLEI
jgi:hypothetical protein